jgi:hypothetical protein
MKFHYPLNVKVKWKLFLPSGELALAGSPNTERAHDLPSVPRKPISDQVDD